MELAKSWTEELIPSEKRTFEFGGEMFEWMYPHWEIGADTMQRTFNPEGKNGDGDDQFSWTEDTKFAIDRVPLYLNPKNDAHKRWKALVARKTDPVPRFQIVRLYKWLVQVTNDLPTNPPSDAPAGGGDNGDESLVESPSPEATPTP